MIKLKILFCSLFASLFLVHPARAELQTFFGENVSLYDYYGPNQVPRPTNLTNTLNARAAFQAHLIGVTTETFEEFNPGTVPTTLHFGTTTANLSGSYSVFAVPEATNTFNGVFPSSGTNILLQSSPAGATSFTVTFSSPQSAFGFFCTDVETNVLTITLISTNGQRRSIHPPITEPQGTAGSFFFGVIDQTQPFVSVEFQNAGQEDDAFGFDDLTIALPEQVIPPTRLTIRSKQSNQVELGWNTVSNAFYQLQYVSSLTPNNWTPLPPTWRAGDGTTNHATDNIVAGQPQRFYRIAVTNSAPNP